MGITVDFVIYRDALVVDTFSSVIRYPVLSKRLLSSPHPVQLGGAKHLRILSD